MRSPKRQRGRAMRPRWRFGLVTRRFGLVTRRVELVSGRWHSVRVGVILAHIGSLRRTPMFAPLAYHITWTTYGTWLSGDSRGWVKSGEPGIREGDPELEARMRVRLTDTAVTLSDEQRELVQATIRAHAAIRGWVLHTLNVRTNHVHVVVTAARHPDDVMEQLKAWCSRRLSEQLGRKRKWWTEHGSTKWINDESYFANAVHYVSEGQ